MTHYLLTEKSEGSFLLSCGALLHRSRKLCHSTISIARSKLVDEAVRYSRNAKVFQPEQAADIASINFTNLPGAAVIEQQVIAKQANSSLLIVRGGCLDHASVFFRDGH